MKTSSIRPGSFKAMFCSLLVGMVPVGSGLLVTFWNVTENLASATHEAAARTIEHLDDVLYQAESTANRLLPRAGQACDAVIEQVRQEVVVQPFLRGANLIQGSQIYCSSYSGAELGPKLTDEALNQRLSLRAGNAMMPITSALTYRIYDAPLGVSTMVDGRFIAYMLELIQREVTIGIEVDGVFLFSDRIARDKDLPDHDQFHLIVKSAVFGYDVHAGYTKEYVSRVYRTQLLSILGTLLLLGTLAGGTCHYFMTRRLRPS
ncbi:CSS-motif domain-containing protein [Pseudomonas sp. nanlin1]|uniref:CSS-motif domain-containing protein n=1 Tax=Pseudomonas sp. nanlin1 TaxID=3040605 RepID=UPI00388F14CD